MKYFKRVNYYFYFISVHLMFISFIRLFFSFIILFYFFISFQFIILYFILFCFIYFFFFIWTLLNLNLILYIVIFGLKSIKDYEQNGTECFLLFYTVDQNAHEFRHTVLPAAGANAERKVRLVGEMYHNQLVIPIRDANSRDLQQQRMFKTVDRWWKIDWKRSCSRAMTRLTKLNPGLHFFLYSSFRKVLLKSIGAKIEKKHWYYLDGIRTCTSKSVIHGKNSQLFWPNFQLKIKAD